MSDTFPYNSPIKMEEVLNKLEEIKDFYETGIEIFTLVLPVLKSWVNKKVTRVLNNKIKAAVSIPKYESYYHNNGSSARIDIPTNFFKTRYSVYISSTFLREYDVQQIESKLNTYKAKVEEIKSLDKNAISNLINNWNSHCERLKELYYQAGKYNISQFFNL